MKTAAVDFSEQMRRGGLAAVAHVEKFAMRNDPVHQTLFRIAKRLESIGVPYAVCGGMALAFHGFVRATVDVDLLVTSEGLAAIHEKLEGLGYVPPFAGSKQLRDVESGVRVEFLVTGAFPGDGLAKPVAFPDPETAGVTIERDGIRILSLEALVELKLASGMTAPHRLKDLADVQQLIESLRIDEEFVDRLNPYVRGKFRELWTATRSPRPDWEDPA